jgi:hypothetical protein
MPRSQSGKGCLLIILLALVLGSAGLVLFSSQSGLPLEGSGKEDIHIQLSREGRGDHVRAEKGYGVILDCEGVIESPPGYYRLKIMNDDDLAFEGKVKAGQKHSYQLKTRWGTAMTIFTHEIQGLSGQKEVKVTYVFKYNYSYKSLLNRLNPFGA